MLAVAEGDCHCYAIQTFRCDSTFCIAPDPCQLALLWFPICTRNMHVLGICQRFRGSGYLSQVNDR